MTSASPFVLLLTLTFLALAGLIAAHGSAVDKDNVNLIPLTSRITKNITNTDASSLYDTPNFAVKNEVFVEEPTLTGAGYRVSANYINLPGDISEVISKARTEKKSLEIFAVHTSLSGFLSLSGVPYLKIVSHNCVIKRSTYIYTYGSYPRYIRKSASTGVTPLTPPAMPDSGDVDIVCNQISADPRVRLYGYTYGRTGYYGGRGGKGTDGKDGTPGVPGFCRSKKIAFIRYKCETHRGRPGRKSTAGTNGARGGRGGDGGDGGNFNLVYGSVARNPLYVFTRESGGNGGRGGSGGAAGKNGKYIRPINYVTGCRSKCRVRQTSEIRPSLPYLRSGPTGYAGRTGRSGVSTISTNFGASATNIKDEDLIRCMMLAERYYNALVLSGGSYSEALSIVESIHLFAVKRRSATGAVGRMPMNGIIQTIGDRARMALKTLELQRALYGPAVLARAAPVSIGSELTGELRYMAALKDQMSISRLESNILAVVTEAAAISIPATDFDALRRDLKSQRDTFQRAVVETEARLEVASDTIQTEIVAFLAKKQDEADRAKQGKIFKAVKAVVNIAIGVASINYKEIFKSTKTIIGTIKDIKVSFEDIEAIKSTVDDIKDEFKKLKNETQDIKELLSTASNIKENVDTVVDAFSEAESRACQFSDIKKLMQEAPDRIDKFPNLVVYESDFSEIDDIGVVSELSSVLVDIRASKLTSQFGCVLGEKLEEVPSVQTAFDNFFTLTTTRVKILQRMVDIDIELKKLKISEEGAQRQKASLRQLRTSVGTSSRNTALAVLGVVLESAKMRVLETIERLAYSYENIVLRDMQKVIKDYATKQLSDNGVCGFDAAKQYASIVKLHADLKQAFRVAHKCMSSRETLSPTYYSFDITAEDSPEIFASGLKTGPDSRTALVLDIEKNCAIYGGNHPPSRGMPTVPTSTSSCFPNLFTYNARMVSISVELVGGDESKLPAGKSTTFAAIDQVGAQTFHSVPGSFKNLDIAPLQFTLGFLTLNKASHRDIVYHPTCFIGGAGLTTVDVDSPRVCPSPYSTYSLQLGHAKDVSLEPYLATVKIIRIHTRMVAFSRRDTASICFD